jgi:signal peptidase I
MSTPAPTAGTSLRRLSQLWLHLPTLPEALASLLRTVVVALFVLTFLFQPFFIPSESMERTLLVGDFLLVNKQVYAPAGAAGSLIRRLLPYGEVQRGDVVIFHSPEEPGRFLIKRVVGIPGDRLRMEDGRVMVDGAALNEPYAAFELTAPSPFRDVFPAQIYTDPNIDPVWWKQMESLTRNGELEVPRGEYFVLGDNRNHSKDSRFWGFVPRRAIVARPLVIYFSLRMPSTTDAEQAADDRLGHDSELAARLAGVARWKRIFRVIH